MACYICGDPPAAIEEHVLDTSSAGGFLCAICAALHPYRGGRFRSIPTNEEGNDGHRDD